MKAEVLGYCPVNFTDQKTGNQIVGTSIYIGAPNQRAGSVGLECTKHFLANWSHPFTGPCNVDMNLQGKVIDITPIK